MAKASSKSKLVVPEEEVEQPKEEVVEVGQTSAVLTEEAVLVEIPVKEYGAIKQFQGANLYMDKLPKEELSKEERIINFLESRNDGEFVINDFLKSLYPIPTYSMPAEYLRQGESKALKGLLTKMQAEGKIAFVDNSYQKLGQFYYEGGDTQTKHYNILNVKIIAKK